MRCYITKNIDGDKKLVVHSFDGASVMVEQLWGVQAQVRETFPSALFATVVFIN